MRRKAIWLLAVVVVIAATVMAGCGGAEEVAVDLYDYETLCEREYYDVMFADYLDGDVYGAYSKELEVEVMKDRARFRGMTEDEYEVSIGVKGGQTCALKLKFYSTAGYNVKNGGFENGSADGWTQDGEAFGVSDEVTYFDNIYTPAPAVGQDGLYFVEGFGLTTGFVRESKTGTLTSSTFIAAGSGYITFKLGGGCEDTLSVSLMCGEQTVAKFNNYMFADPYRSIGMTSYYYVIPEEYMGKTLHFVLSDGAKTDFGALTADSFRTYYETEPNLTDAFPAGMGKDVNAGDDWIERDGGGGTKRAYSPQFKADGNIAFTLGGGASEGLKLRLIADGVGEVATFNNWRKSKTDYIYVNPAIKGKTCRFILDDTDSAQDLTVEKYGSTQDLPNDITVFAAGFVKGAPYNLDAYLLPQQAQETIEGDFETMNGWNSVDMTGYGLYDDRPFFADIFKNNPPIYGADGKFLTGCYFDGDMSGIAGTGTLYSRAFVASGSGYITFKMGGANLESLHLKLMKYSADGNHTEIARFNNYLFSDPYRSMALTRYGFKIPSKYMGQLCFFELVDNESFAAFGALSLDSVNTYHAEPVVIYEGTPLMLSNSGTSPNIADDNNIYPAGYMTPFFSDVTARLKLGEAARALKNGGFENGSTGWFSADANAFASYRVSNETTYFESFYPANIPVFNKTGSYFLNGFAGEAFVGSVYSEAFIAGGWITFKLGGGNSERLKLRLMRYVDGVDDEEIACFNNYMFSDPYRSMAMTRYAYEIPAKYDGEYCYFIIEDGLTTNFGAITADEFITAYSAKPIIDGAATDSVKADKTFHAGFKGEAI